jgi:hypothetical protein
MKSLSILVLSFASLTSVSAVAAETSKPAKVQACPAGQVKVLIAKAYIVNEDGSIKTLTRSICVSK